ncbi:type IV toxin-antitoxin system AbiEi family antitoxin domain-containing protein [Natronogracilivirga saccharolytica]|uniref:Type IV toxin-antitoxin system AbiEi family antitoxin n=1 Tax=Natronogracilivirga saccharolytica TaxID=2812953 RepID=A0A8J7RM77_9BACT|nr:type IV toxin-antitoxin system AbiEi family antitoxin [Natronogracilivirga saccharolytica]MBP3193485.1 type IV toxin-antitoxin system AbiEi family antitoxin [Natronogracilivirga saccharolytica]
MGSQSFTRLEHWVGHLLATGKYAFSWEELKQNMPHSTTDALKQSLNREVRKNNILSIHKGYYIIIPPSYKARGILPPTQFIDGLMHFLKRPYYVGLLSAASMHGAAHQQPQEFFVVTELPVLRPTRKKGIKVNYLSKKNFPKSFIQQINTETGFIKVSSPLLTAVDLIQYNHHIGGINRSAVVLHELMEVVGKEDFTNELLEYVPVSVMQRLGYLLEYKVEYVEWADTLFRLLDKKGVKLFRTPLKTGSSESGYSADNRWKVLVNVDVETD